MTAYVPTTNYVPATTARSYRGFLWCAGLTAFSGVVVLYEPAPYDLAVLLLLVAGLAMRRLKFTREHRIPLLLLAGWFATCMVSLLSAEDAGVGIGYAIVSLYLAVSWVVFAGVSSAYGSDGAAMLLKCYAAAGWSSAAIAALSFFHIIPFQEVLLRYGRAQALFKDPNVYGPYLVPVVLWGWFSLERPGLRLITKVLHLLGCGLAVIGVFLSFSRAAWLNTIVSTVVFLSLRLIYAVRTRQVRVRMFMPLLALPALALGTLALGSLGFAGFDRLIEDRLGDSGLHGYDNDRFDTQRRAIESVSEKPLGMGPGQSEVVFNYSTHSMYFRILGENGFFGFIAFYGFVLVALFRALRLSLLLPEAFPRDVFALIAASIVGLMGNGLVIDTIHWRELWFLLALAWWVPGLRTKMSSERTSAAR